MTTEQLSAKEIEYKEVLLNKAQRRIMKFLEDYTVPYKYRLLMFLSTPKACFESINVIPAFARFAQKHGDIDWKEDFPFLLRDQSVNLVKICRSAMGGNYTYFPAYWTREMVYDFVKECVDQVIHEFDYCW